MTLRLLPLPDGDQPVWRAGMLTRMPEHRVAAGTHDASEADAVTRAMAGRLLRDDRADPDTRLWQVEDGGAPVGSVWLDLAESGGPVLIDLALDEVALGPQVRLLVEDALRAEGADSLSVSVHGTDEAARAFVAGGDFSPAATQMTLPLEDAPAASPVELRPMTPEFFAAYAADDIEAYAQQRHGAGLGSLDDMRKVARDAFAELLPDGLATADQHLWSAYVADQRVGLLWIRHAPRRCYVYNVVVDEAHRGAGHGRAIMDAGAARCRDAGAEELGLNVFGQNTVARRLYDSLGYRVVEELVRKSL
ncbi:GNAT family N-acetyltransferase [Nocardioides sp. JQ2195]|uniref:GNAT family N-acetyltransferase n=1 Tax=Nocardioides sp. JQ2195 TaxID=2592334 RepID=UPI00143E8A93|nr:GNAT family N-acetyltransferase [Nocardioides sp. JQ2195]QIX27892.1 GNAT family N-acetyltransferase [Nocardioides sp. JQ2195]